MSQPNWKACAQLGDVNPTEYGGYWVLNDLTGVYPSEAELLQIDEDNGSGEIHRFILDKCTFVNGVLSDNRFHPEHPAWFADDLQSVADCMDTTRQELIDGLCNGDPIRRAEAYRAIGDYHGFANLDEYPLQLTKAEIRKRYKDAKYQTK